MLKNEEREGKGEPRLFVFDLVEAAILDRHKIDKRDYPEHPEDSEGKRGVIGKEAKEDRGGFIKVFGRYP